VEICGLVGILGGMGGGGAGWVELKLLSNEIGFSSHLFLNRVCTLSPLYRPDQYIHDSKKGVMRSQFHLTRALGGARRSINSLLWLIYIYGSFNKNHNNNKAKCRPCEFVGKKHRFLAELFPIDARAELVGLSNCFGNLSIFLVVKTFPNLSHPDVLGLDGTYWLYASVCVVEAVFGLFFLPETKGKHLEAITEEFANKNGIDAGDKSGGGERLSELDTEPCNKCKEFLSSSGDK
jgi:hypothetical protein